MQQQTGVELAEHYPLVRCATHVESLKPGYSICEHVANGADAAVHYAPTKDELGHVVCDRCQADELSANSLRLSRVANALELHCSDCVAYHLADRLPPAEVTEPMAVVQLDKENRYVHSHPFDFESVIVHGELRHTRYLRAEWGECFRFQQRKLSGEFTGEEAGCLMQAQPLEVLRPGDRYTVISNEIHSVDPDDGTVTFVTRRFHTRPEGFCSYWPEGKSTPKVGDGSFARPESQEDALRKAVEFTLERWKL